MIRCRSLFRLFFVVLFSTLVVLEISAGELTWTTTRIEQAARVDQEAAEAVFHFKNTNTDDVTILEIRSSCGCTTATLDKKTYAPGEEGDIHVKFTFGGRTGAQQKEILVISSDTPAKPAELVLRVAIPEPFIVEPRLLVWEKNASGPKPEPKSAKIVSTNGKPISVTNISNDNPQFETKLIPEHDGQQYRLLVTPTPDAKPGKAIIRFNVEASGGRTLMSAVYAVIK